MVSSKVNQWGTFEDNNEKPFRFGTRDRIPKNTISIVQLNLENS